MAALRAWGMGVAVVLACGCAAGPGGGGAADGAADAPAGGADGDDGAGGMDGGPRWGDAGGDLGGVPRADAAADVPGGDALAGDSGVGDAQGGDSQGGDVHGGDTQGGDATLADTADPDAGPDAWSDAEDAGDAAQDAGDAASGDGGTVDAGQDAVATGQGTWDDPIPVATWPFVHHGDTTLAPAIVDAYGCAPATDESGGEVVYALDLDAPARLTVTVSDLAGDGVDVDVHLLSAPDAAACLARSNVSLTATVPAGPAWVVVDTWADAGVPLPGPYTLSIDREGADDCSAGVACPAVPPAPAALPPEPPGLGGCPPGMARVEAYCVDRWEAALVDDASGAPLSPYAHPPAGARAVSVPGAVPQAYVSGTQAAAACAAAGKRLCTDAEWLRACKGPAGDPYPYGPAAWAGFCNDARACHPAIQTFGTTEPWIWSSLGDPCIAQQPWGLAPAGAYEACESAEGLFDLVGNLHEWTADPAGTFRGGFYVDTVINGKGCAYVTTAHDVGHWDYSTGFRCCAD